MKPIVFALASVVLMTAACGGGRPASPTAVGPTSTIAVSGPASAAPSVGGTTTWSCFAGSRAGIFASTGCPSRLAVGGALLGQAALIPFFPTGLAGSVNGSTVTLTWSVASNDPAGPPTSFVVQAGSSSGASNLASFDTGGSGTTLTVTDVPAGTYYVRVQAKNSSGVSGASNEVVITVGPVGCVGGPGAPSGLAGTVSGGMVTLTWTAPAGGCSPTSYNLQAGSSSGLSNLASFNTGSTATTYVATGVPAGTYYVRVVAVNGTGQSASSIEIVVTVGASPGQSLTGRWIGLVANGDGLTNPGTLERWDLQLDLTQLGSAVTGTYTQTEVLVQPFPYSPGSTPQPCAPNCAVNVVPLTGTAGSGTYSFTVVTPRGSLLLNGTFTASRMTGTSTTTFNGDTGTFALNRQ